MTEKIRKFFAVLLLCVFAVTLFCPVMHAGEAKKVIRVAYGADNIILNQNSNGFYQGYGVAYLNKISQYTGWTYEYVEESWEKQLQDLKDGKIDLICTAQKTEQREKEYDFSALSVGTEETVVYTREDHQDNKEIYYQDYEHMDGRTVGMLKDRIQNEQFREREHQKGFTCQEKIYTTDDELLSALSKGSVDMIVTGSLSFYENLRTVDQFGTSPFYFMTVRGNEEVMNPLNRAQEEIESTVPNFQEELWQQYYENQNTTLLFTREETEYIRNNQKKLKVACISEMPPLCYEDKKTGELTGIYIALLERLKEISGLDMEFISVPYKSEPDKLAVSGKYDFIAGTMYNQEFIENPDVQLSEGFFNRAYYLVVSSDTDAYTLEKPIIAMSEIFDRYRSMLQNDYGDAEYLYTETSADALDAVLDKKADGALVGTYIGEYYLKQSKYRNLTMTGVCLAQAQTCLLYPTGTDTNLVSVINKSIGCLTQNDINEAIRQYSAEQTYEPTLKEALTQFKTQVLAVFLLFGTLCAALSFYSKWRNGRKLKEAEREIYKKRVETDSLTGLLNKEEFYLRGQKFLEEHQNVTSYIVFINVENFKLINDLFSVKAGDQFLQYLAGVIRDMSEQSGAVCTRYESDHFVMLTVEDIAQIRKQIENLSEKANAYELNLTMEISAGIYEVKEKNKSLRIMCDRAHLASDSIKNNHLVQVAVYDDSHRQNLIQEQKIISQMNEALKEKQFKAYFQPKYDMRNDEVIGAEALVRWEHPEKGIVSPGVFIPVFEKNGFIGQLDLYIYEETCEFLKKCMDEKLPLHPISINLSRVGFYNPNLCDSLCQIADKYGIPRKYLELEVTETAYTNDSRMIFSVLERLRKEEFRILMDDFGSGYSSLNMLKEAPIDEIKLDMRFLSADDPYGRAENILHMVIAMGNQMKLSVIAEGVETQRQKEMLQNFACNKAQGYYYAKPMKRGEYVTLLKKEV